MLIDLLDAHAGAIQALSTIVLVFVTGTLVWVTRTYADAAKRQADYAKGQLDEAQRQRFDQHRPVVHPLGSFALTQNHQVDWYQQGGYDLQLQNVGTGVALVVCGVMFPPEAVFPRNLISPRYSVWRESALLPGQPAQCVKLVTGGTLMDGDATIGDHRLFAPKTPTQDEQMLGGHYNVIARLTLTYEDIFLRKHAAAFDYIDHYGWQCVALLPGVAGDLEDLDQDAHKKVHDTVTQARNAMVASRNNILRR